MRNVIAMILTGSFLLCGCERRGSNDTDVHVSGAPKVKSTHNPSPPGGRPPGFLSPAPTTPKGGKLTPPRM
jgi:hypothetical protein